MSSKDNRQHNQTQPSNTTFITDRLSFLSVTLYKLVREIYFRMINMNDFRMIFGKIMNIVLR